MSALIMNIEGGTLIVCRPASIGDVTLSAYSGEHQRLAVLAPSAVLLDDGGIAHYIFTKVMGERGLISTSDAIPESVWVFSSVVEWLRDGREVTIACVDVPAEVLAAMVLVAASGNSAPSAIEMVARESPAFVWEPDVEIPVSVFAENVRAAEASS